MASLYKRDGQWYISYYVDGKRFRVSTETTDKKLAQVKFDDLKVKLFKGEIGAKNISLEPSSLPDFFRRFLDYYRNNHSADTHAESSRIRVLQEFFARKGVRHIRGVTPGLLEEFVSNVLTNHRPKTKKNYITLLKTAMNRAVEWGLIDANPIANVRPPKIVKTFHFFSIEEVKSLIDNAVEPLRTAIIILVNTGLRRAELYHLRWKDVDIKNRIIRVWPYSGFIPKGKRPRAIPISDSLFKILFPMSKKVGASDFVFRPFQNQSTIYEHFKKLLLRLNLQGTLHDLRHTFASHLSMAGVPIPVIKDLMGHSDIATTMIYAHLSPGQHQSAIEKLPF